MRRKDSTFLGGEDERRSGPGEGSVPVEPAPPESAYGGFGDRVAGVLRAAEAAAEEIRAEAEADAEAIRRAAQDEAEEILRAARQTRAEAEEYASDTRLAVEAYANKHRRDAEEEGRRTLDSAQAEARAVREAAEGMAQRGDEEARSRRTELLEENRALEEARRRTLEELREIASHLDDVVGGARPARPEAPSGTIADALSLRRRR